MRRYLWLLLLPFLSAIGQSQSIHYSYDQLGRVVGVVDQSGNAAEYVYDATGNIVSIIRYSSTQVAVLSFSPASGSPGTTVTIEGANFSSTAGQDSVSFNGTAAQITSATSTTIVAVVPTGATSGTISVTAPLGSASSLAPFTVTSAASGAPTISGISPNIAAAGDSVTLSGTNFSPTASGDIVSINGYPAPVSSVSSGNSLSFTVPSGVSSGNVTLLTPAGSATSTDLLYVPPSPYTAAQVAVAEPINVNQPTNVSVSTSGSIALLTFSGTAGQTASLQMTNSTFTGSGCGGQVSVSLIVPNGTTLTTGSQCSNDGSLLLGSVTLPVSGTYTILIEPLYGGTGGATFEVNFFSNVSESLTPGTPSPVAITFPGQLAQLTFAGTAGQLASIQMTNSTFPGYGCDDEVNISVLGPNGLTLSSGSQCSNNGSLFLGPITLPLTGTYTVAITPIAGRIGTADITAYFFSNVTGPMTPGTAVPVNITTPGQQGQLTFTGTAGQLASVQMLNSTFAGDGCGGKVNVSVLNPDGSTLALGSQCSSDGSLFIGPMTLPSDGTYTLLVQPINGGTGSGNFTVYFFSNVAGPITPGTAVPVTIDTPGQQGQFTFAGTAGQLASVQMLNSTFMGYGCGGPVSITVLNPDGSRLVSGSQCSSDGSMFLGPVTLPATGTYTVLVQPTNGNTGSANVTVYFFNNVTGTITPGTAFPVSVTTPGQQGQLTFSGTAGQLASMQMLNSTFMGYGCGGPVSVTILSPDGSRLVSGSQCSSDGSMFLGPVTLPATGTYTLLVQPTNGNTGSANVTVYFFDNVTGTITPGTAFPVSVTTPGQQGHLTFGGTAGQLASVQMLNSTFQGYGCGGPVSITVLNPDGSRLASNSQCSSDGSMFTGPLTLPSTGTYTLQVIPTNGNMGSANFTVYFFSNVTGAITPGTVDPISIGTPGQQGQLTFTGAANQSSSLQMTTSTFTGSGCGGQVNVSIMNPDGSRLAFGSQCSGNGSLSLGPMTLPADGTYTVLIQPVNGGTGGANFLVELPASTPTFSVPTGGYSTPQSVSISDETPGAIIYFTIDGTTPTTSSPQYTAPINVYAAETIEAMAVAPNYLTSAVASNTYQIAGTPAITGLSITSGVPGIALALQGYNFGPTQGSSTVSYGSTTLTPLSWSPTAVTVTIPPGAVSSTFVVTVAGVASNAASFTVVEPTAGFERAITISHNQVPNTDQVNFPVLVAGTYPYLATTANGGRVLNTNGYDIVFTSDATGQDLLDFEIDTYDATTGQVAFWIRIPTLSHTADTTVYMWYGIPGISASQENRTLVWNGNYVGVWHFGNGIALSTNDSTRNGNNGVNSNVMPTAGRIGGGASFDGSDAFINLGDPSTFPSGTSPRTICVWANPSSLPGGYAWPVAYGTPSGSEAMFIGANGSSLIAGSYGNDLTVPNFWSAGTWQFVCNVYDGSTAYAYGNGTLMASASKSWNLVPQYAYIGKQVNGGEYWPGSIDEVTISSAALSPDWIATEYNNQSSPATFYTVGEESAPQ